MQYVIYIRICNMFPYILIFWYPCRDWLAGNSQAFPGPDATIRAIPDKNYSSIYLHTLASICKKSFNTFVAGCGRLTTWENNNNMKVKTLSNTMTQHLYFHDKENIFHYTFWSSTVQWYFSLYLSQPNSAHSPYLYLYMYLYLYSG